MIVKGFMHKIEYECAIVISKFSVLYLCPFDPLIVLNNVKIDYHLFTLNNFKNGWMFQLPNVYI